MLLVYSGLCGRIDFEAEVDAGVADTATELKVEAVEGRGCLTLELFSVGF